MAEQSLAGNAGRGKAMGDLRSRFRVDVQSLDKLVAGITQIRKDFEYLNKSLPKINDQLNKTLRTMQGIQKTGGLGGGSGGQNPTGAGVPLPLGPAGGGPSADQSKSPVSNSQIVNIINPGGAGAGGDSAGGGGAKGAGAVRAGFQALSLGIQALDSRIDNNYLRSLSVDKLAVYYQQNKGISNMQYIEQMRDPMRGARLGYGGINTLLSLQASTGISAQKNAAGIAGLRAVSGYSYSTEQMAQMAGTLGSAAVNNRMTMMLGTGLYGFGGQQNSMNDVIKQIVQRTGLTNADRLAGARQQGSNTRAMLESAGVPPDMIDLVLDYAEANQSYQKKTGSKDMYDPTSAKQRRIMGIEDNFATQAEETARTKEARDEQFYKRQADNYAQMEKGMQGVIEALGKFEDTLSGLVGVGVSTKGGLARKVAGGALMLGGLAVSGMSFGLATPVGFGMATLGASMVAGDPIPEGKTGSPNMTKVPLGYSSPAKRVTLGEMANTPSFSKLNSKFRDRLLRMFAENPNVGLGVGHRSETDQRTMFMTRYRPVRDGEKPDLEWDGQGWKHTSGAPAAPPGRSMHEIGLAADLVGDLDWVVKNAEKFGLKTFAKNLNEPWHVQPLELPDSRYEYEKQGSPWGQPAGTMTGATTVDPNTGKPTSGYVVGDRVVPSGGGGGMSGYETFNQFSISNIVSSTASSNYSGMDGSGNSEATAAAASGTKPGTGMPKGVTPGQGAIDPYELARMLYARGFRGQDVANMLAISYRESRWVPGVLADDDDDLSYGLFQINMKGDLGPSRLKQYKLSKNEDLYDPKNNVKAARILFGGGNYSPWAIDGNPMAKTADVLPKAMAITKELGYMSGDPMSGAPTRGSTNVKVSGGTNVTISPNIYVTSSGSTPDDARRMANEIARILEQNLKREVLRTT
jgi:hypothetical protein